MTAIVMMDVLIIISICKHIVCLPTASSSYSTLLLQRYKGLIKRTGIHNYPQFFLCMLNKTHKRMAVGGEQNPIKGYVLFSVNWKLKSYFDAEISMSSDYYVRMLKIGDLE